MDLKLKCKLKAYTKSMIPDVSEFIKDAEKDGKTYGRKDGNWVDIDQALTRSKILPTENSGLNITQSGIDYYIGIRQWEGKEENLPELLDDTTYYVYDTTPDYYLDGGTAYSSTYYDNILEQEEIVQSDLNLTGGNSNKNQSFDLELLPINCEGEYDGN